MAVILERNGQLTDHEAKPAGDTLEAYRSQAHELQEAVARSQRDPRTNSLGNPTARKRVAEASTPAGQF